MTSRAVDYPPHRSEIGDGAGSPAEDLPSPLLYELAGLFRHEEDAIRQPYAWPPRTLAADERREADRLCVTASRIAQRAARAGYEEAGR